MTRAGHSKIISSTLDELGYDVEYRIINAKGFVPQNRKGYSWLASGKDLRSGYDFKLLDIPAAADAGQDLERSFIRGWNRTGGTTLHRRLLARVSEKYILTPKLWNYLRIMQTSTKPKETDLATVACALTPQEPFLPDTTKMVPRYL
ncbi:DNA cytosine methyltransferase [Promineifilum sp.]|uniref:DNA cytosine methyltransferase n=1 Tax=Promineifilum sp. TaxID=2664178 RepID=UPI0031CC3C8A